MDYYKHRLYLFGGRRSTIFSNDFWIFSINRERWKLVKCNNNVPPKCAHHCSVIYHHYLILFGGLTQDDNENWICYNDLFIFNFASKLWTKIECDKQPESRYKHSMCISKNQLIIYGGLSCQDIPLNDMHSIDLSSIGQEKPCHWNKIQHNIGCLFGQIMASHDYKIFIHGGSHQYNSASQSQSLIIYEDYNIYVDKHDFVRLYMEYDIPQFIPHFMVDIIDAFLDRIHSKKTDHICDEIGNIYCHNGCLLTNNNHVYMFIYGGFPISNNNHSYLITIS